MVELLPGLTHLRQHPTFGFIEITGDAPDEEHRIAAKFYEEHPDEFLHVRETARLTDLNFFRFYPRLKNLYLSVDNRDFDLTGISHVNDLWALSLRSEAIDIATPEIRDLIGRSREMSMLMATVRGRKIPAHVLDGPDDLIDLHLMGEGGTIKDISALSDLKQLQKLGLASTTVNSVEVLQDIKGLEKLYLAMGGTKDLSGLMGTGLRQLSVVAVRQFTDMMFLTGLQQLEELELREMRNVVDFPDLSCLTGLTVVDLDGMKGIRDLTGLASAPALETLSFRGADHLKPEILRPLVGHPTLKRLVFSPVWRTAQNDKRRAEMREMFGEVLAA